MKRITLLCASIIVTSLSLACVIAANESFERRPPPPPDTRKKPSAQDVPFATVDSGSNSGVNVRQGVTIKEQAEWMALWRRHTSILQPPPSMPAVDFSAEMVVAVFSGERKSGGHSIQVDNIKLAGNRLIAMVSESNPAPGRSNMMMVTQPFHIVRLGKSNLPIVFQGL